MQLENQERWASKCGKEYQARQESNKIKNVQVCLFMVVARTGDFVMMLQHPRTCYLFFSLHLGLFPHTEKTGNIGAQKIFQWPGLLFYSSLFISTCKFRTSEISQLIFFRPTY